MAQQTPNGVFWFSKEVTLTTLRYPGGPTWVKLSPTKGSFKVAWQKSGDGGGVWLSGEEEEAESIAASSEEEEEAVERLLLLPASPTKARGTT